MKMVDKTNRTFMKEPHSGGTNNMMTRGSIEMLATRLDEARKFTWRSVFVDFGWRLRHYIAHLLAHSHKSFMD